MGGVDRMNAQTIWRLAARPATPIFSGLLSRLVCSVAMDPHINLMKSQV